MYFLLFAFAFAKGTHARLEIEFFTKLNCAGFILLLLLSAGICKAEFTPCIDTLSAAKWGELLKYIPKNIMLGGFAKKEFGDLYPIVSNDLSEGRIKWRVNLLWSDTHFFSDKDLEFVKSEAERYQSLCKKYPGKVLLSTFTEHNLKNPDTYHDEVQKVAPDCEIVNQPWKGALSKKYLNELHGTASKVPNGRFAFSYDGENSLNSDVKATLRKFKDAEYFCVWHPRLNLKYKSRDKMPRSIRNEEAKLRSPDKGILESLINLF